MKMRSSLSREQQYWENELKERKVSKSDLKNVQQHIEWLREMQQVLKQR